MPDQFEYDIFLSHSSKDKAVVRDVAERLRRDGVKVWLDEWEIKPGDSIPAKIEEGLERSRVLVLCMSANAFSSDWAQLESGTFRFRDPLNKERRLLPLRLDDAPIKGSLAQFLYIDWLTADRDEQYGLLLEACHSRSSSSEEGREDDSIRKYTDHKDSVNCVCFSADGLHAVSGAWDRTLRYWNVESGEQIRVLKGHTNSIKAVALSGSGELLLSGGGDKPMRLWNVKTGKFLRIFRGHIATVQSIDLSEDGDLAISGSQDGTIRLWDVARGKCSVNLINSEARGPAVYSVALSPDEAFALSGAADGQIRLWDIDRRACVAVFTGHRAAVECVCWSPDGRRALSCSYDRTLRLWDLKTGQCLRVFEGHSDVVHAVAIAPDGKRAVSCSGDRTLRVWELDDGRCLRVWKGHRGGIYGLAISPDGTLAISASWDHTLRLWDLSEVSLEEQIVKIDGDLTRGVPDQVEYSNAKVLVVGDSNAGKTALSHRLATGEWKPSEDSTVGAWSTQWQLKDASAEASMDREIWLWDFGGQADQRLIHQLYMDHTALILLLFNADQEDVLPGLRDWQMALRRSTEDRIPHFLVAGRIDTGFKASRGKRAQTRKSERDEAGEAD